ncbi:MAG: S-methyl-5-thioribose-1-phosphate isomerase, partial [Candidatus Omnitrophica bacterium]|nr:S-methyl-5-thioribose-1-phosphate isomerase [Candidatus Omnitrophota bacterium]
MKNTTPLFFFKDHIKIVDQRKLPLKLEYVYCRNEKDVFSAIKKMKIRGAPAIGVAAAFGVYLGINNFNSHNKKDFAKRLKKVVYYLAGSRPTAVNLFWALEEIRKEALANYGLSIDKIRNIIYQKAVKIMRDDQDRCRR